MVGISEWFRGQTVVITGGTGFMGQALIYKLMQIGCPKILVLIRAKKGRTAEERLEGMIKRYTFDSLRDKVDIPSILVAIPCNIEGSSGLGISKEHEELIINEATVVLHGAASVKFDDPLKVAAWTNLRMTRDVLDLTKRVMKLQLFTYVSTAFANCEYMINGVEERLYDAKMDWRSLIEAVETLPDEMINSLEGKLLGASPNTYIFTKHLTESLVKDYATEVPTVIVRPPIVIGALKEPEPGWINNLNSPTAIVAASGKGVLRLYHGPSDAPKAYVSIDTVVNGTLAAMWHIATHPRKELVPVYNTNYRGMPASEQRELCYEIGKTHPLKDALWYRHFHFVTNRHAFLILHLLVHVLPGLLVDAALKVNGMPPMLTRLYRKLYVAFFSLKPFLYIADYFHFNKFEEDIMNGIPEDEKEIFYLDLQNPDDPEEIREFMKNSCAGFRAYVGEPREISPKDIVHQKRLYYLDLTATYLFYLVVLWCIPYNTIITYVTGAIMHFFSIFDINE